MLTCYQSQWSPPWLLCQELRTHFPKIQPDLAFNSFFSWVRDQFLKYCECSNSCCNYLVLAIILEKCWPASCDQRVGDPWFTQGVNMLFCLLKQKIYLNNMLTVYFCLRRDLWQQWALLPSIGKNTLQLQWHLSIAIVLKYIYSSSYTIHCWACLRLTMLTESELTSSATSAALFWDVT